MKKHLSIGLSAFALAAALSGCAGATTSSTSTTAPTAPAASSSSAPAAAAADLMVAPSRAGQVVVDKKGLSVYVFTKDTKDSATSSCTGTCANNWPAVTTTSDTPAATGVMGTIGTAATPDGKKQLTINGMRVYYFAKDQAPGDILGQGVGGVWYLVAPSGAMITSAAGGY